MFKAFLINALIRVLMGEIGQELGKVICKSVVAIATQVMYRDSPDKPKAAWDLVHENVKTLRGVALEQLTESSETSREILMKLLVRKLKDEGVEKVQALAAK